MNHRLIEGEQFRFTTTHTEEDGVIEYYQVQTSDENREPLEISHNDGFGGIFGLYIGGHRFTWMQVTYLLKAIADATERWGRVDS